MMTAMAPGPSPSRRRPVLRCAAALALPLAMLGPPAQAAPLPAPVAAALRQAQVDPAALAIVVEPAGGGAPLLAHNATTPMNPASLAKLVTTYTALDRLGPAYVWRTPVWLAGEVRDGVLHGDLVLRGSGDPTLVVERLWLLLRRVMQAGVRDIAGDIVLDRSAFAVPDADPGDFDGEPLRPYNVRPDALLLNYRSVVYRFVPEPGAGRARVSALPPLAGADVPRDVPLTAGPCGDWRAALQARFGADGKVRFAGRFPAVCGEKSWPVADPAPASYDARLLAGLWREMGGRLGGRVREGRAPDDRTPDFEAESPPLADVVRDINKFSNNLMARQLFLTLGLAPGGAPATPGSARQAVGDWLRQRLGDAAVGIELDNGAGLSRASRISAAALARLLQLAWAGPVMPELLASLPVAAVDGTLRRAELTPGRAHLKTGSLRDVAGVAGVVLAVDGRRFVVVALVNDARAAAARPALTALVQWAIDGAPASP
jgi:D-alanyl-D-alanine carboxypeptidase/D-alanyl-D-alanine-endopeptidase (penicillin-binding protein 4)